MSRELQAQQTFEAETREHTSLQFMRDIGGQLLEGAQATLEFARRRLPLGLAAGALVVTGTYATEATAAPEHSSTSSHSNTQDNAKSQQPEIVAHIRSRLQYGENAKVMYHNYTKPYIHLTTLDDGHIHHGLAGHYEKSLWYVPVPKGDHVLKVYRGKPTKDHLLVKRKLDRKS